MKSSIILALLAEAAAASSPVATVAMPIQVGYGVLENMVTTLLSPTYNSSQDIKTIYDLGSDNFFVFQDGSIMNWGCGYLGCQGPCNASVPEDFSYDPALSTTKSDLQPFDGFYGYGGGLSKIYEANSTINDTFIFTNAAGYHVVVPNIKVALAQYLQQRIGETNNTCAPIANDYSQSILGISMLPNNSTVDPPTFPGPSFRQDLIDQGRISGPVQSMWFEQAPDDFEEPFTGVGLLGGIDTSKFEGPLVKVPIIRPDVWDIGYYTNPANMSFNGIPFDFDWSGANGVDTYCIVDSGTNTAGFNPPNVTAWLELTGLRENPKRQGSGFELSWPGSCDTIPANSTMEYTFHGVDPSESVTVKVPLRNYHRYQLPEDTEIGWCTTVAYYYGCDLDSTFLTSAFFAADDGAGWFGLAQGAIAPRGSGVDYSSVVASYP